MNGLELNRYNRARVIGHGVMFDAVTYNNLSGIHKEFDYIGGHFYLSTRQFRPVTHILGILLIKGITRINLDNGPIDKIMNKHLKTRDIVAAQDELIDAGFIEQAKL